MLQQRCRPVVDAAVTSCIDILLLVYGYVICTSHDEAMPTLSNWRSRDMRRYLEIA